LLGLEFEGWAQCRLATDPDPSDEPRGVSGWTFAVAGEPDLDRVLRFQPAGATQRVPGPAVGVRVTGVARDGTSLADSPLAGAPVNLLGDPVFDGRNGLAYEDTHEPIVPVHLRIEGGGVALERRHADATGAFIVTPPGRPMRPPAAAAAAIGVATPADQARFRSTRADQLREALRAATSDTQKAALGRRLQSFGAGSGPGNILTDSLGYALPYHYELAGLDPIVEDPNGILGPVDGHSPWTLDLVVGIWDADALCTYIVGGLQLPLAPPPA
jgi:hypothetical protein